MKMSNHDRRTRGSKKLVRNNPYRVRLNDEESAVVEKLVKRSGMNVSDVFRKGIAALEREVENKK